MKLADDEEARNNASSSRRKLSPLLAKPNSEAEQQQNELAKKRSQSVSNLFRKNNQTSGKKPPKAQVPPESRDTATPYRAEPVHEHFPMQRSFDLRKRREVHHLSSSSVEDLAKKVASATKLRAGERVADPAAI